MHSVFSRICRQAGLIVSVTLIVFFLVGCQTSQIRNFERIEVGWRKTDVVELLGSPNGTERVRGKDIWTYILYEEGVRYQREVEFTEGKVTYTGRIRSQVQRLGEGELTLDVETNKDALKKLQELER